MKKTMDTEIQDVLDIYHAMIETEHNSPRELPPGGRDGGQDQRLRAVRPETGQFINILARSLKAPTILELGTSFGYSGIWLAEAARASGGRLITWKCTTTSLPTHATWPSGQSLPSMWNSRSGMPSR